MLKRILVVDDEEQILFAISDFLSNLGYEVYSVTNLDEAQCLLGRFSFTAVIADLCLSNTHSREGFAIIGFVRERTPQTRTILLTAHASHSVETEARSLGVDAFFQKPIPLKEIAKKIL